MNEEDAIKDWNEEKKLEEQVCEHQGGEDHALGAGAEVPLWAVERKGWESGVECAE